MNSFRSFKYTPNFKPIVILLSILVIAIFLYSIIQVLGTETYPLYSDEYEYSKNMENFLENHTLSSALTLDEKYSKIGNYSFHGFSYTLLYGYLATVLHTNSLIVVNIFLSLLSLLFILLIKELTFLSKIRLIALLVSYPVFYLYALSYMVESIHLLLSVIISYFLYKYLVKNLPIYKWIIIAILFASSILRQTWFVYIFSIFFKNGQKGKWILEVFLVVMFLSAILIELYFFYASYENSFLYHLLQKSHNLYEFINTIIGHFNENLQLYFFNYVNSFYYFSKIGLVSLSFASFYYGLKEKNNYLLSISFIGWCYFFMLLFLYNATAWRELRVLGVVYISLLVALSLMKKQRVLNFFFIAQILLFPSVIEYYNDTRTIFYQQPISKKQEQKLASYNSLASVIHSDGKKEVLIIVENGLLTLNYNRTLDALPLKAKDGTVLRYSIGYFSKFRVQKTKGDYLLTKKIYPNLHLITKNDFFNLYKTGNQK